MSIPSYIRKVLPDDTAASWETLASIVPRAAYLGGGTALAAHLQHRVSQDLDFFFHRNSIDLDALERNLAAAGTLRVDAETRDSGTLNGVFNETKVQFLHADEGDEQHVLVKPTTIAGIRVASVEDVLAMKLTAIRDRAQLRDYFDLMTIEQQTKLTVERGLELATARYQFNYPGDTLRQIVRSIGYLGDVDEDSLVPVSKQDVAHYWAGRQRSIISAVDNLA